MRPTYETNADLTREEIVARSLSMRWGLGDHKLPKFYQQDWCLTNVSDNTVRCILEIKCRSNRYGFYPTLILSLAKWRALCDYTERTSVKGILAVGYTDGIYWMVAKSDPQLKVTIGGRTDRNDPDDVEPVIHIPINKLTPLITPDGHPAV